LDAFVRTCLVRAFLAESRRSWRRRECSVAEVVGVQPLNDSAEAISRALVVREALRRLAPRERAVLVLRFYEDLSVADAARALSCTEGTIKSQTARGLAALRALLDAPWPHTATKETR
jgi:RNA polymerase sigma factor (sigma-70 family)